MVVLNILLKPNKKSISHTKIKYDYTSQPTPEVKINIKGTISYSIICYLKFE